MAGLEVVVRPVVFPDIRPRPTPALAPADDPTKGFAVIQGNPAGGTSNSYSVAISSSHTKPVETERRVDEARIYQMDDDGAVNRDNFIDVQVANRITMADPKGGKFTVAGDASGVERSTTEQGKTYYYKPIKEADNVEIKQKNLIIKSD